jgi:pimeloyl-ACP methyl ester carboxylesterase
VLIIPAIAGVGLGALAYARYRPVRNAARARVSTGSHIAVTSCGPIEYSVAGEGPTVLVVHGAGGGFDQGLDIGDGLVRAGFRVIAPSRFGYLRTPLPGDSSPEAQADAHACLLDTLDIPDVAIMGVSAGGPSALQFALRFPARTRALVLLLTGRLCTSARSHSAHAGITRDDVPVRHRVTFRLPFLGGEQACAQHIHQRHSRNATEASD